MSVMDHPLYGVWSSMIQRCTNPNVKCYRHYGGRGIKVCDRWRRSFRAFADDVEERPSPRHTLDRIDNDGDYEPGNVRWATKSEQRINARGSQHITINGVTKHRGQWCKEAGVSLGAFRARVARGLTIEQALQPHRFLPANLRMLTFRGEEKPLSTWARELGMRPTTIKERLRRGWPLERALTERVSDAPNWRRREATQ